MSRWSPMTDMVRLGIHSPAVVAPSVFARAVAALMVWLALPAAAPAQDVRAEEAARVALVEKLSPTVVCIFPKGNRNGGGSGVIIDAEGYGLTNYHVVASLGRHGNGGLSDGKLYPLEVLGFDPSGDIAMFRLTRPEEGADGDSRSDANDERGAKRESGAGGDSGAGFAAAPLGDSDALRVGDETLAMGNPFLLSEDYTPTVTFGIVGGVHRYLAGHGRVLIYTDCIEIGTSINPGNSGGPLFNMRGALVGINGRIGIEERGRVNVGVGYAVSVNQIKRFLPALRAGLVVRHATLGATVEDKTYREVVVNDILETTDAYRAGLRTGDQVLTFNGQEVRSANQLLNLVSKYPERWPAEMTIRRGGKERSLSFRLDSLPLPKKPKMPRGVPESARGAAMDSPSEPAMRRETRRVIRRAHAALGGDKAAAVAGWTMTLERRLARSAKSETLSTSESRSAADALDAADGAARPGEIEAALRWSLMTGANPANFRPVGVDEMGKRLVLVLERELAGGRSARLSIDDETGDLLRTAFDDPTTGKAVQYDYGDFRAAGPLRLPHRRVLRLAGEVFSEDVVSRYRILDNP